MPCPAVRGCLNTRERWSAECPTFGATRSKDGVSSRWPSKTFFSLAGKRTSPTNAFTARPATGGRALRGGTPPFAAAAGSLFPCYQEARRTVNRDSFVEVQRAFYEAPPEYIGRQVWVRCESRCVRIFNERMEQVQIHTRLEAGKFSRILGACGMGPRCSPPAGGGCNERGCSAKAAANGRRPALIGEDPRRFDPSWDFAIWLSSIRPPPSKPPARRP